MKHKVLTGLCFSMALVSCGLLIGQTAEEVSPEKKKAVKESIRAYIQQDERLKGAFFIKNEQGGGVRELAFDHIHEGVYGTEEGNYYACVDFRQGTKVVDLDMYVRESPSGNLEVSEIVVHKIDGKQVRR